MDALRQYLEAIRDIQSTQGGTRETSFYAPLETLLNLVGQGLTPKVRCISQLADTGAGKPDFGLFTADQFQRAGDDLPRGGQKPERGVLEVKGFSEAVSLTSISTQVKKYVEHYDLVLVTNYWQFQLIERGSDNVPAPLESFQLAESAEAFQDCLRHAQRTAQRQSERLQDFLRRCLCHKASINSPEELAWLLASYAREARHRVEERHDLPGLATLKLELERALGLTFTGEQGEHFFRATLVQTLFYGIFASWVLSRRKYGHGEFNWRTAAWHLHVPMVRTLFEQIATPGRLGELGVTELLDWTGAALARVDADVFFARFEDRHAVQYFYEPFLKAYDPELRKELGVWYTPPEIVRYQVARVDRALREDLGLEDGLADERVVILDPCCGTGAYLVEVLRHIHESLCFSQGKAMAGALLPEIAARRVFGFEILPAPFVISHLQIGLLLTELGAAFTDQQRAGVYLTNALTGWDPAAPPKSDLPIFPELNQEREAAARVKQQAPILVILGNPPYNAFAGTVSEEEGDLVAPYKTGLNTPVAQGGWGIRKFNLDDLYVRFFRIAERRIAQSGRGVVCYISNFSYLGGPSFTAMRQRLLAQFQGVWIDCLNGDSRETGKVTPEGLPDPSVFSTPGTPEGIRVGTAICLLISATGKEAEGTVRFRHFWGSHKREELLASLDQPGFAAAYQVATPSPANRFSFRPGQVAAKYASWPAVTDLCLRHFNGPVERRALALISMSRDPLENRLIKYFDSEVTNEEVARIYPSLMMTGNRIVGSDARKRLLSTSAYHDDRIVRYDYKPMDVRFCYLDNIRPLFSEPSPELIHHSLVSGNLFLVTRDTMDKSEEGSPFYFAARICDYDSISGHARHFPVYLNQSVSPSSGKSSDSFFENQRTANLSTGAIGYLRSLGYSPEDAEAFAPKNLLQHVLAIGYSPGYLEEHADGIRDGWPRVPLPAARELLEVSAALGRRVAALLDMDQPVPGVTTGALDPRLRGLGELSTINGGALNPGAGDLDLTVGWGHEGRAGVCMPGRGRTESLAPTSNEDPLGARRIVVYLNERVCWSPVPQSVWDFTIGGYQVIKKWLSYRERRLLGRGLTLDEAASVTQMVRRLAALVLLREELDASYHACAEQAAPWPPAS